MSAEHAFLSMSSVPNDKCVCDGTQTQAGEGGPGDDAGASDGGNGGGESAFSGEKDGTFGSGGVRESALPQRAILGAHVAGEDIYLLTVVKVQQGAFMVNGLGVSRFDLEGNLDTGYGQGGTLGTAGVYHDRYGEQPIAVDAMRRLYTVGSKPASLQPIVALYRHDASGQPDTTFGSAGQRDIAPTDLPGYTGYVVSASALTLHPDGDLLLGGYVQNTLGEGGQPSRKWFVAKLNPDGSVDSDFNDIGYALIDSGMADTIGLLHVAPDGAIFAMAPRADIGRTYVVAKLAADGKRDMDYGESGLAVLATSVSAGEVHIRRITVDDEGRVIGAGEFPGSGSSLTAAYAKRLAADGSVDSGFGTSGEVKIDFVTLPHDSATWHDYFYDVWLDGDQIVLAGYTRPSSSNKAELYALARLNDDGALDADFPYTKLLGRVWDATYAINVAPGGAVSTRPAVVPTPDGTQVLGFSNNGNGKIQVVRWE